LDLKVLSTFGLGGGCGPLMMFLTLPPVAISISPPEFLMSGDTSNLELCATGLS